MALKTGIVGLPNVGKSTLFNAITNSQVEAANYPFATIEPNVGVVELQDERLNKLKKMIAPEKVIHATFEFIDIAGLVEGASKGEGLGNKFLANIREVDAIVQVVRCFEDDNISHILGTINPVRDMDIINTELMLADMETLENVVRRTQRIAKNTNDKKIRAEYQLALKLLKSFEDEIPARNIDLNEMECKLAKGYNLLTLKPLIYVGNIEETLVAKPEQSSWYQKMQIEAIKQGAKILGISAKIESELTQLEDEDQQMFLEELGVTESGLNRLTRAAFELLNLSTYFTAGKKEVRAWTFSNGMTAPQCAGIIHTDFERGFIKAEVIKFDDFIKYNGEQGAKQAGKYHLEGKDYIFKDGDMANFKFNV